jgi:predicted ATPase
VLYQNALYRSLTPSRRVSLSAAVAEAIVDFYGEHNASLALELALLYEIARDFAGAADAFARAARNAVRVAAYQESVLLAQRGLKALKTLPDTLVRAHLELELQLVLGLALTATKGYAAPDVEQAYTRARMLCERADDPLKRFRVLDGLWRFYSVKPDLVTSTELAQQLLELAQRTNDTQLVAIAHCSFGTPSLHRGLFDDALDHMNQALALYDPQKYQHHIAITGADLGVRCHTWVSLALWLLGYADQAAAQMDLALTRAGAIKYPFSQAFAASLCAWQHHFRRQPAVVRKYAEEALGLSAEHSLGQWVPVGLILKGWALAEEGETAEGTKCLRSGLDLFERTGAELNRPHFVSMLAEAYARAGQLADAIRAIDDALVLVERNQDRYWKSELLRLKGDFLLALSGAEDDAERCFSEAVMFARSQKARLLELRAATSLCRLWKRQNRAAAQRDLNTIYRWFTEGHATRDLMEASWELTENAGLSEQIG